MKCKECEADCKEITAKTEKNFGRQFWSCPNRCKCWNGWVETGTKQTSNNTKQTSKKQLCDSDDSDDSDYVKPQPKKQVVKKSEQPKKLPKKEMFTNHENNHEDNKDSTDDSDLKLSLDNDVPQSDKKKVVKKEPLDKPKNLKKPQQKSMFYDSDDSNEEKEEEDEEEVKPKAKAKPKPKVTKKRSLSDDSD